MKYGVYKKYTFSSMAHLHSIELTRKMAEIVAKVVSYHSDVEATWVEEIK